MKYAICTLAALFALSVVPRHASAQIVAQYYGTPYYYNYNGLNSSLYHQRLNQYNGLRYGYNYTYPYQYPNYWNNQSYYNGLWHRGYHRGLGYAPYVNSYYPYGRSGVYYNSPGFGFGFSF